MRVHRRPVCRTNFYTPRARCGWMDECGLLLLLLYSLLAKLLLSCCCCCEYCFVDSFDLRCVAACRCHAAPSMWSRRKILFLFLWLYIQLSLMIFHWLDAVAIRFACLRSASMAWRRTISVLMMAPSAPWIGIGEGEESEERKREGVRGLEREERRRRKEESERRFAAVDIAVYKVTITRTSNNNNILIIIFIVWYVLIARWHVNCKQCQNNSPPPSLCL